MVKMLDRSGPDFWIEEPLTERERRMQADDQARYARKWLAKCRIEATRQRLERWIAEAPAPPVTRAERAAFNKDYPPRHKLLMSPQARRRDELEFYAAMGRATNITYYGGAPHRPKG